MARKTKAKWEFGDFQTPQTLAEQAISVLRNLGIKPQSVIEPTCGKGSFLLAAANGFPEAKRYLGVDVNKHYLSELESKISRLHIKTRARIIAGDFFSLNWSELLTSLPEPILIVGNPPWVTSAELGMLQSNNLPQKSNFQERRGYDAITGKSNFDISEWMLLKHLEWLGQRRGVIAMLCKTAVSRKVLLHAWKHSFPVSFARLFLIDAQKHFGASVDACFLVVGMTGGGQSTDCPIYESIEASETSQTMGYHDGLVLANIGLYQKWQHLKGEDKAYVWRSGIKHDCSKVMEMERSGSEYRNGAGEFIALEDDYLYPMLKSSDIGNGGVRYGRKYMLVTQQYVGEETKAIRKVAPKTWQYLESHQEALAKRASSIYQNRAKFSIFGVGAYSFSPWKVAISGFYKQLAFKVINPYEGKTVVLDDTVCFLPCWSESEALFVASLLNSEPAQEFYRSMIFWADKRPITIEILKKLNLQALSTDLGCETDYLRFSRRRRDLESEETEGQLSLGIAEKAAKYDKKSAYKKRLQAAVESDS
ncbi:MAG TPA: N-6 DNA methylase [Acidiferrobacterales bacterium]|nr:N-6 DNA methylase [Acidiferrobacterales bacterium]